MTYPWVLDAYLDLGVVLQSFFLVAVAEVFDKTWFVALLMALRYSNLRLTVLISSSLALGIHTLLAAIFGLGFARYLPIWKLQFAAAGLYLFFASMYLKDWWYADPSSDIMSSGKEDAEEALCEESGEKPQLAAGEYGAAHLSGQKRYSLRWTVFSQCFITMFVAEWGDRTQIAMIGQHASHAVVPVVIGSFVAFLLLTCTAILTAMCLSGASLREKTVHLFACLSFFLFAAMTFHEALTSMRSTLHPIKPFTP